MRSAVLIGLVAFVVVIAGGFTISWYGQATAAKQAVEQTIAQINAKEKYLTYDTIETSGFPNSLFISIVKPHFRGRVDQLLQKLPRKDTSTPLPQWDEDALLDGKIVFGTNTFSDHYAFAVKGNWNRTSTINGQTISTIHQQSSDFTCTMQFQPKTGLFDSLWNLQFFDRDFKTMASKFRLFDCNSAGGKSINSATKEVYSSVGPVRIYLTSTPQQGKQQVRFYVKVTDMEVTPQGDAQIATYIHAISPTYELPLNFSSYGKHNIDIDFTYSGSSDWKTGDKNPLLDIALNKFDITNQVYNTHTMLHFSNTPSGNNRTSALSLNSESEFSEQYDTMMHTMAQNVIKRIYNSNDPKFQPAKAVVQQYTPEQLYSIVYPVIPSFHGLGKILISLNGNFKGSADSRSGDFALEGFHVATTPYGINGMGSLKVVANQPPQGTMQLNCDNCLKLIDDMFDYATRIQTTLRYFAPDKAQGMSVMLEPAKINAIKTFLSALAAPPAGGAETTTLSYAIVSADKNITINGKSLAAVATLYNQYIRPAFQPVASTPMQQSPMPMQQSPVMPAQQLPATPAQQLPAPPATGTAPLTRPLHAD